MFRLRVHHGAIGALLLAGITINIDAPAAAATPSTTPLAGLSGYDTSTAAGYAAAMQAAGTAAPRVKIAVGLGADDTLTPRSVLVDRPDQVHSATLVHIRYDRTYKGIPVEGGQLVVGATASGQLGDVVGSQPIRLTTINPSVTAANAEHASTSSSAIQQPKAARHELVVFMTVEHASTLAWAVTVAQNDRKSASSQSEQVFVDANSGDVIDRAELDQPVLDPRHTGMLTLRSPSVAVPSQPAQPATTQVAAAGIGNTYYGGNVGIDTNQITQGNGQRTYALQDPDRGNWHTDDYRNHQVFTNPNNIWGNHAMTDPATVAADAQYGVAETWDFFQQVLGRVGIDGRGTGAYSEVHYDEPGNSEWNTTCQCLRLGDGVPGVTQGPLVSLDIVAHEYTHAITLASNGPRLAGEPSEIEESLSDMFGMSTTFYAGNPNEPGSYILGSHAFPISAMRHMDNPAVNGAGINCYYHDAFRNKYVGAGVGNHMFYLLAEGTGSKTINNTSYNSTACDGSNMAGVGRNVALHIWGRALFDGGLRPDTQWQGARDATVEAARDLYGTGSSQCLAVEHAWQAVSVPVGTKTCGTSGSSGGGVVPDSGMNTLLGDYGNAAGCADWSGADATDSVVLPSGDRAYFFSDSYLGSPAERPGAFFHSGTRNSIIVQHGGSLRTITGGNTCQEHNTSLDFWSRYANTSITSGTNDGSWYWTGEAKVVGSNVIKFYYRNVPQNPFWIETNTAIATIPISSLENQSVINIAPPLTPAQPSYGAHPIIWGTSLLDVGPWTYIYGWGVVDNTNNKQLFLARTEPGNLANWSQWQFNTGGGADSWSARGNQSAAHPVTTAFSVEAGYSVIQANGSYWLIQHDPNLNGGSIVAHLATTPWSFTSRGTTLYTPPEGPRNAAHRFQNYYEARVHPGLTGRGNDVVISYNVNTTGVTIGCRSLNDHDAGIYRPRFIDVPIGNLVPAFSVAQTAPLPATGPARADPHGIHEQLTPPPPGAILSSAVTGSTQSTLAPFADTGIYDQWDQIQQLNHGCPPLDRQTALSVTGNPDGSASLSWSDYGTDMWYWVSHRDLTAGEDITRYSLWASSSSWRVQAVTNSDNQGDTFEWAVIPFADGDITSDNMAPLSNLAEQTISVAPPSAPTNVIATITSSNTAIVSWSPVTYPSNGVYYYIATCGPIFPDPCDTVAGPLDFNVTSATIPVNPTDMYVHVWALNLGGAGPATSVNFTGPAG